MPQFFFGLDNRNHACKLCQKTENFAKTSEKPKFILPLKTGWLASFLGVLDQDGIETLAEIRAGSLSHLLVSFLAYPC